MPCNKHGSSWIRKEKRLSIYIRDGFACQYCGRDLRCEEPRQLTLDHLTPRSQGGTNNATNLILACLSCNSQRGAKDWTEYATGEATERITVQRRLRCNVGLAKAIIAGEAGDPRAEEVR